MPATSAPIAGRIDYAAMRDRSDAFIQRHGTRAVLRRYGAADRPCDVVLEFWTAQELLGRQYDPLSRKAVLAAGTLQGGDPVMDQDRLVTFVQPSDPDNPVIDEELKITAPPIPLKQGGVTVQWTMAVRA